MKSILWIRSETVMIRQILFVVILLKLSVLTATLQDTTNIQALINVHNVLSTEQTIFYYPRTSNYDENNLKSVNKNVKVKRHVIEYGWEGGGDGIPTETTVDKPIRYYQERRHISHRDVGGIPFPSTSPKYPPQIPSYAPPSRTGFFTPPLPPEYLNPFADKPTLRGSNSESNSQNSRRPIPPPPPVFRPFENSKDRVPLPPPDLLVPENKPSTGKKALNTPSRPNSHQTLENAYKDMLNNNKEPSRPANDTDFDFVPILQYPSVSRILSGSSGRRHEMTDTAERHSGGPNSRHNHHNFEHMAKNLPNLRQEFVPREEIVKPVIPDIVVLPEKTEKPILNNKTEVVSEEVTNVNISVSSSSSISSKTTEKTVNNNVSADILIPQREPPTELENFDTPNIIQDSNLQKINDKGSIYLWGIAWDIHVYLIASLFTLLSLYAVYNLILLKFYKHLLSYPYFISVHVLITIISLLRAVYLFHDAYNVMHSYPEPISHLMLNITCPLITTIFGILFLFLVKTTEVDVFMNLLKHPVLLIIVSLTHLGLCICLDLITDESGTKYFSLVCQCLYIFFCLVLGSSYLYMYSSLANSASRKQIEMFGTLYTTTTTSDLNKSRPDALCFCIRITLAVAMLILLMAVVQLYGIFGVPLHDSYSFLKPHDENMQRWIWWAYQFSVRVIEIAICYLVTWASTQRLNEVDEKETNSQNSTTGFALFPCGPCRNGEEPVDDIYPAVCNTNQAIHNYSIRTGKKVYDDVFPLNNIHKNDFSNANFEFQENSLPASTYDRRKTKRSQSNVPWHLNPNQGNNYDEIGPGSEIIEIKDALTRKGLANLNRSDSDTSHNSHIPPHVSYESIGYHSANRPLENSHFEDKDSNSEHGSNLSKTEGGHFFDDCDSTRGSFTTGHKRLRGDKNYVRKSGTGTGTLGSFSHQERRRVQTLREGKDLDRSSPNSMLVDENGFVRFRSIAEPESMRRNAAQNKKSLPRRNLSDDGRSSR